MVGKNNKTVKREKQGERVTRYSIKKVGTGVASVAVTAGLFFASPNAVSAEEQPISEDSSVEITSLVDDEDSAEAIEEAELQEQEEQVKLELFDALNQDTENDSLYSEMQAVTEDQVELDEPEVEAEVEAEPESESETEVAAEVEIEEQEAEEDEEVELEAETEEAEDESEEEEAVEETEETEEAAEDESEEELEAESEEESLDLEDSDIQATTEEEAELDQEAETAQVDEEQEAAPEEAPGLGTIQDSWERIINENAVYRRISSENENGLQKANIIEFNPLDNEYRILVTNGEYIIGGDVMSKLIAEAEAAGYEVAFAVNGDGYDTSNGVPHGMVISDGIMLNSSNADNRSSLGFLENGEYVYGNTNIDFQVSVNGEVLEVNFLNRERKLDEENVYMLTEQFAETSQSSQAGVEVILEVTTDGYRGVEIGNSFNAVVKQVVNVFDNFDKNQTPIGSNHIILSAHANSSHFDYLNNLQVGDIATIDSINNSNVAWEEVQNSIGIFHILMQDGVETSTVNNDTAIHPRTVVGFRPDGSMILMQNEGRQSGYATGLSFREIVDYLTSQGADTIFNFDGGGSSTIAATMPGNETADIINRPSDGWERSNANGLLVLKKTNPEATNEVEQLHLYPDMEKGYQTEVQLLENGVMDFIVKATDDSFNPVDFNLDDIEFSVTGGIGTIDENGRLIAAAGAHSGQIIATHIPTNTVGVIDVSIVDSVTQINVDVSQLSVAPEGNRQLNFTAEKDGVPVIISPEALTFTLSDDSLGYITDDGIFHANDTQGNGELTISYKGYDLTIPVEVGRLPVELNDFEGPLEDENWEWRIVDGGGTRGGDGNMSINYDERFVKYGDGSLRIDYDFATNPVTGTVSIEAGPKYGYGTLDGQPQAIGVWIYGDSNDAWIRIQLSGGTYAGDVYVDWDGWRYIETPIPSTAPFPYELEWGIRVLATPGGAVNGKKGTLYVDGLRAVYDYTNDDLTPPVIDESYPVTPEVGAVVDGQPLISMKVYDPELDDQPYTGIDTERTKLWINGVVHEGIQHEVQQDGSVIISYIPSALTNLRPGPTNVRIRVEDNAGNKFFEEWDFVVEGYAVNLIEEKPASEKANAGSTFDYAIHASDFEEFESFDLELAYSPNFVELLDVVTDPRIENADIQIDEAAGLITISMSGMKDYAHDPLQPLVSFTFSVENESGGQTGIRVLNAVVRQTGEVEGTNLALEGYDQEIEIPYTITYDGTTTGYPTTIRVTDADANPVSDMTINVTVGQETFTLDGVTDENGELVTDVLTNYEVGTVIQITTVAPDGGVSNTQQLTVEASLGDVIPDKIGLTTGFNPATSVGITWETSLDVESGYIQLADNQDMADAVTVEAISQAVEYRVGNQNRLTQRWGATIVGLNPGTTYYYQVGEGDNLSDIRSFTTAEATDNVDIAVIGDLQGAYHNFPGVFEHVEGVHDDYDLIMQVGDFNDNANDYAEWERIMDSMQDILSDNIWAVTVGNHDSGNDAQAFTSYFNAPDNGTYDTSRNYWFEIGDAVVYVMDSEGYTYDPGFEDQKAKMEEVFTNTEQTFKMVLMHRPPFPQNYNDGDVRALAPFFESMGVDVVFSGHDHIYSRTSVTSNNNNITHYKPGQSTTYVTMGSSTGSKYYNADSNTRPWSQVVYDDDVPTFGYLSMEGDTLTFTAYAIVDGQTQEIDTFSIQKLPVTIESEHISGPTTVSAGADTTYTVTIPEDYALSQVLVNGEAVPVDENNQFTITAEEAMTLQAFFTADKAELEHALGVANNLLDMADQFTPESEAQLATAVADGNSVVENADATPEQVEAAVGNIMTAIGQLVSQGVSPELVQQLEDTIAQLSEQIDNLTGDNTALQEQVAALQDQLANLEELTDAEIAALQAEIAELETSLAEAQAETEAEVERVEALEAQLAELQVSMTQLEEALANSESENTDLAAEVGSLSDQLPAAQNALAEALADNDLSVGRIAELEAEVGALQAEITELAEQLAAAQGEASRVEALEAQIAQLQETIGQLADALASIGSANETLVEQVVSLSEQLTTAQNELAEALADNEISEERISELEAEVGALQADIAELEDQLVAAQEEAARVEALEAQIASLGEQLTTAQNALAEALADNEVSEERINELEAEVAQLESEIAELQAQLEGEDQEAQDQFAELEERLNNLLASLEELSLDNESLQAEIASLKADIAAYQDELGAADERITALEERIAALEAELQAEEDAENEAPNEAPNEVPNNEPDDAPQSNDENQEVVEAADVIPNVSEQEVSKQGFELPKTGTSLGSIGAGIATLLSGLGLAFFDRKRKRK